MRWMFRVACSIKAAVRLVQTGFQHLEHFFVPLGDLIPVAVFDARTLDLGNLADLLRPQAVDILTAYPCNVSVVDVADQLIGIDLTHRLEHVSLDGFLRHAKDHIQPRFSRPLTDPEGNDKSRIYKRLPGTYCPGFNVPAVRCVHDVFILHFAQLHCHAPPSVSHPASQVPRPSHSHL